jgi:hypothetical protein
MLSAGCPELSCNSRIAAWEEVHQGANPGLPANPFKKRKVRGEGLRRSGAPASGIEGS